jgi:hypothetical protein
MSEHKIVRDTPGSDYRDDDPTDDIEPTVPASPNPPNRHQQDTQPVEGDAAMNLPRETEGQQRPRLQG